MNMSMSCITKRGVNTHASPSSVGVTTTEMVECFVERQHPVAAFMRPFLCSSIFVNKGSSRHLAVLSIPSNRRPDSQVEETLKARGRAVSAPLGEGRSSGGARLALIQKKDSPTGMHAGGDGVLPVTSARAT